MGNTERCGIVMGTLENVETESRQARTCTPVIKLDDDHRV